MPTRTIEYLAPQTIRARSLISLPVLLIGSGICATGHFISGTTLLFEGIYRDFHTDLPDTTSLLLSASRWYRSEMGWPLMWATVIAVAIVWARVKPKLDEGGKKTFFVLCLTMLVLGISCLAAAVVLVAPLVSILQTVSSPK